MREWRKKKGKSGKRTRKRVDQENKKESKCQKKNWIN